MSAQPAAAPARLDELEVRIGYLDDLLDGLNRTIYRQQQQIDQLAQAVAALRQQVQAALPPGAAGAPDERPPHY